MKWIGRRVWTALSGELLRRLHDSSVPRSSAPCGPRLRKRGKPIFGRATACFPMYTRWDSRSSSTRWTPTTSRRCVSAVGDGHGVEYGLPALGHSRLRALRLGEALPRELARDPEVALPHTGLRDVCSDDRSTIGWDRRILQAREQGLALIRRGSEPQDLRHSKPCILVREEEQ